MTPDWIGVQTYTDTMSHRPAAAKRSASAPATAAETFHDHVRRLRHEAIVDVAIQLLAEKGYEAMRFEDVAQRAAISRMGLYRYFASKEELAAATMRWLQQRTLEELDRLDAQHELSARERLEGLLRWAVALQLRGRMPNLPSQDSALTEVLTADEQYMTLLDQVGGRIVAWLTAAQAEGAIDPSLPADLLLMVVFARACDPVPPMLRRFGHADEQIADWAVKLMFQGLAAPPVPKSPARSGRR